ncbi:hypothetical protein [Nocardioides sp.]|uniref:hypothetical protein n=1 Tax=Nocardioides sp. TaxID=35761 RepID=UPI00273470F2|nr:hypothetical protein [Nocardioides sp.]MDP3893837.1 hypothetical protein [Nocardioides sp.]
MTEASNRPDVFLTQIDDAIDAVSDAIGDFLEASANVINQNLTLHGAIIGGLVAGPFGALGGGLLGNNLQGRFDDAVDNVNETWRATSRQIRQSVGSMLGDPLKMSGIASQYRDAVTLIGERHGQVSGANSYVAASWRGRAHIAYANTSTAQLAALQGMSDMLGDAADLLDDHAVMLLSFWNQQLQNLIDLATSILGLIGELGDVGNWFTAGAGVLVQVIAEAGSGAAKILTDTNQYMIDLNVGRAGDWSGLDSRFGDRGLPGKQWPDLASLDRGNLNGPWQVA